MMTVHLRVNDETTGQPTPVRLRVTGLDGTYYAPLGRLVEFATGRNEDVGANLQLGREPFAYIDGTCEIGLPTGVPLRVQALKGPEYEPLDQEVILGAGQMALRLSVRRWSNLVTDGWFAGDARAHFIPPHAALLEAAAEDVTVVNVLVCATRLPSPDGTSYPTLPNMTAFSGQTPALEADGRIVVVNTLNTHPVLGRVGLLNCHRTVFPLSFGGDDDTDDWSVTDWCRQCHRKQGLTVWVDAFRTEAGIPGGETLIAAVLGEIDAIEFDAHPRVKPFLPWWYRLLNAGIRLPLVGSSGKDSNRTPIGAVRTYAKLSACEPFSYKAWIEAVRSGQTFITNGPLLRFETDTPAGLIRAAAESLSPFDRLEIVGDARVIATASATKGQRWTAKIEMTCPDDNISWLAARCVGGSGGIVYPTLAAFAHTSPVYLRCPNRRSADLLALRRGVEQTRDWIELHGRFTQDKRKQHLLDLCNQALARLSDSDATSEAPPG